MEFLLASIESAYKSGALLPALITALIIPDIAGKIDYPNANSCDRYTKWLEENSKGTFIFSAR